MKTKLLRKVRKKYSIIKYRRNTNYGDACTYSFRKFDFYEITKGVSSLGGAFCSKNEAIELLIRIIKSNYAHTRKRKSKALRPVNVW